MATLIGQQTNTVQRDIFGTTYQANTEIYEMLTAFASPDENGIVRTPDGQEFNVNKLSGMTAITTLLQLVQGHKELIDNIFTFIKNLENKLDNLLSS
jgi:hypothetical protein